MNIYSMNRGDYLDIIIKSTDKIAIYEQIYEQIKNHIISGSIAPDEPLPSIRALAKGLRVSVITTKRAYEELERDGYIYTVSGKGSYAAHRSTELIREEYLMKIEENLQNALSLASVIGMDREELIKMLDVISEEDK